MLGHIVRSCFAAAVVFWLATGAATAQEASPEAGPGGPPLPAGCGVLASGLVTPRFVAVADDGTVYVTEAGIGGDEAFEDPLAAPPEDAPATPLAEQEAEAAPQQTRGFTGQVSAIAPDGTVSVLATGFASYSGGVGPGGITIGPDGMLYIVVGGSAIIAGLEPLQGENTVFRIDPATGETTAVAELGSYEVENNPDGTDVNPNLYGLALGGDGMLYASDAGGNIIYQVDPETGDFSHFAVVPALDAPVEVGDEASPVAEGDPAAAGARQPVPTGLAVDADGALNVVLLSEFWPPDAASVLTVGEDGAFTGVANGLFFAVALTAGPDSALYVTQIFASFEGEAPGPGNVLRILEDGTTEVAVDGLALPHGAAFDAEGNLYVTAGSIFTGPEGPPGQVLRCVGVAVA